MPVPIPEDELQRLFTKVCASVGFETANRVKQLFRCLFESELEGSPIKGKRGAKEIATQLGMTYANFRQTETDLRRKLRDYYLADGDEDPIHFDYPRGDHRLKCVERFEALQGGDERFGTPARRGLVQCSYVGDDDDAIIEILQQMESPAVIGVRDTHICRDPDAEYSSDNYQLWRSGLASFLSRAKTRFTQIGGWPVDRSYVRSIAAVEEQVRGKPGKITTYRLRTSGPVMNFILVDFDDGHSEVFFGYGRHATGNPEAVFRSSEPRLVEEFSIFFDILIDHAEKMDGAEQLLAEPWLYRNNPSGLHRVEEMAEANSTIYLITPDLYNDAVDPATQRIVNANHKRGITYKYITRNNTDTSRAHIKAVMNAFRQHGTLSLIYVVNDLFDVLPTFNVLAIDRDNSGKPRVFVELPVLEKGERMWWVETEFKTAEQWREKIAEILRDKNPLPNPDREWS